MARVRGRPPRAKLAEIRTLLGVIDEMPPDLRALVHEFDYAPVVFYFNQGVEDPQDIRAILIRAQR